MHSTAVAHATADFSGADLRAVIDSAVEVKLQEAVRSGVPKPLAAARRQKPSTGE